MLVQISLTLPVIFDTTLYEVAQHKFMIWSQSVSFEVKAF